MDRYQITLNGKVVNYVKHVPHGAPYFEMASGEYQEAKTLDHRAAKRWFNQMNKYFDGVGMVAK